MPAAWLISPFPIVVELLAVVALVWAVKRVPKA